MISKRKRPVLPVAALLLCGLFAQCVQENDELTAFAPPGEDRTLASLLSDYVEPNNPGTGGGGGNSGALPPPVRPTNRGDDDDNDLLSNGLEDDLIRQFAPFYYLHSNEKEKPSSVNWVLERAGSLRFSQKVGLVYREHIVPGGRITMENLGDYKFTTTYQGRRKTYSSNRWYDVKKEGSFHMYFGHGRSRGGNLTSTRCYALARISPDPGVLYEVQYHWFYPYNPGWKGSRAGAHAGDWENVTVRVKMIRGGRYGVHSVVFYGHGKPHLFYPNRKDPFGRGLVLDNATRSRPNVHSAVNSHAAYPSSGKWQYTKWPIKDKTNFGSKIDCLKRYVNIGNLSVPSKGNGWIKYDNKWGSRYGISSVNRKLWQKRDWEHSSTAGVNVSRDYKFWRSTQRTVKLPVSITSLKTKVPGFRITKATIQGHGLRGASIRVKGYNSAEITLTNYHGAGIRTANVRIDYTVAGQRFYRTARMKITYSRSGIVNPHDDLDKCGGRAPKRGGGC